MFPSSVSCTFFVSPRDARPIGIHNSIPGPHDIVLFRSGGTQEALGEKHRMSKRVDGIIGHTWNLRYQRKDLERFVVLNMHWVDWSGSCIV